MQLRVQCFMLALLYTTSLSVLLTVLLLKRCAHLLCQILPLGRGGSASYSRHPGRTPHDSACQLALAPQAGHKSRSTCPSQRSPQTLAKLALVLLRSQFPNGWCISLLAALFGRATELCIATFTVYKLALLFTVGENPPACNCCHRQPLGATIHVPLSGARAEP